MECFMIHASSASQQSGLGKRILRCAAEITRAQLSRILTRCPTAEAFHVIRQRHIDIMTLVE